MFKSFFIMTLKRILQIYKFCINIIIMQKQSNTTLKKEISDGVVHKVPDDLRKALNSDKASLTAWNNLTPLGRNEFICWIEDAKQIETRNRRLKRTYTEIKEGKRRPCCWAGCSHR